LGSENPNMRCCKTSGQHEQERGDVNTTGKINQVATAYYLKKNLNQKKQSRFAMNILSNRAMHK